MRPVVVHPLCRQVHHRVSGTSVIQGQRRGFSVVRRVREGGVVVEVAQDPGRPHHPVSGMSV